jgi:hypothetical protein
VRPFDDEIREHFADLRAEDASRAPRFPMLWTEAERRAPTSKGQRPFARPWVLAAAAGVVAAAAVVVQMGRRSEEPASTPVVDPAQFPSITAWRAPTDGFLFAARRSVGAAGSTFGSSLDAVTRDSVPPNFSK